MSDMEKVISGLQYTVNMFLFDPATGYSKDPDDLNALDRITYDACVGAIALLKEQEAKLLTFDEVKKHYSIPNEFHGDIKKTIDYENDIVPLYLECTYEDEWVVHWRDYHNISMHLDSWEKDYGKTWRCWTAKPTDEQRKAVKWDA